MIKLHCNHPELHFDFLVDPHAIATVVRPNEREMTVLLVRGAAGEPMTYVVERPEEIALLKSLWLRHAPGSNWTHIALCREEGTGRLCGLMHGADDQRVVR